VCKRWISLDTETAHNHDDANPIAWIYQWAFKFGDDIVIGRRPREFIKALQTIHEALELSKDKWHTREFLIENGLGYLAIPSVIEGDYEELMEVIKECQKVAVKAGAESVSAYVKIVYRPEGEVLSIEKKVTKHHQ
jgi:hypothetical protein